MPVYTYECERGHQFERWQGIKDEPLVECEYEVRDSKVCFRSCRRIIVAPGGHVVEPNGVYQPLPGMDPKTKRTREEKISKREFERRDQKLRAEMLDVSKHGPRLDLEREPKRSQSWF